MSFRDNPFLNIFVQFKNVVDKGLVICVLLQLTDIEDVHVGVVEVLAAHGPDEALVRRTRTALPHLAAHPNEP